MSDISAIILAAGAGTRMKSSKSKVVHEVCFKPLVKWVYDVADQAGASKIVTVVGYLVDQVKECLGQDKTFAIQEAQLGTGHAVVSAMPYLQDGGCVIVLSGDVPLISVDTLKNAIDYHLTNRLSATVITAEIDNPFGYGRIVRDENDDVHYIVEEKDATNAQKCITEINSGLYCFDTGLLRAALSELSNENAGGEYYLTDTIAILLKNGYKVGAYKLSSNCEIMGINDRRQLSIVENIMRDRILEKLMISGVTIIDPHNTYISADAIIGKDCIIYPGTIIEKGCIIGENCVIGPNTNLKNMNIGANTEIENSTANNSSIGENTHVGPYAYIRPGSVIGNNIKIGDFVEIKNSVIKDGTKVSHLTYVGDSDVGENVNFGCGTVTVNYDGKNKFRTTIGDNAFIGCNTNLVAPVKVGDNAFIAAGSTITDDVPDGSLAIARTRQEVKEGWRTKKIWSDKK